MNPRVDDFVESAKRSGIADKVTVITNGLLLPSMSGKFWDSVDKVVITLYPGTKEAVEKRLAPIARSAERSGTELSLRPKTRFRVTILTRPQPDDRVTGLIFKTCRSVHFGHCHMLHEGKLYKCAVPPFLPAYLSRLDDGPYDPGDDALDIRHSADPYGDLKAFLLSAGSLKACRYCLGYIGRTQEHRFLAPEFVLHPAREPITRETHLDRRKLAIGALRYRLRRLNEKLMGRSLW